MRAILEFIASIVLGLIVIFAAANIMALPLIIGILVSCSLMGLW